MTTNKTTPATSKAKPVSTAMIFTLGLVSALSGFLVVFIFQITKPIIKENQRLAVEKAVLQVIPGASTYQSFLLTKDALLDASKVTTQEGRSVYAGYDEQGVFLGVAAEGSAQGYADLIHIIYGYKPSCQCITGIKVIKLAETPGLGDKIITNKKFVANFDALDVALNANNSALANAVVSVKHGSKENPWEVDAITGATISSKAVARAINGSAQAFIPQIMPYIDQLQGEK